jgi:hypothetical protein
VPRPTLRARSPRRLTIGLGVAFTLAAAALASCSSGDKPSSAQSELACKVKPTEAFHERIEPLLSDSKVTTCNQCHLSGVNLSAFARETPCKTLACLKDQGLVDLDSPEDSRVLAWIRRASPDSELITQDVIDAEYDSFLEWIDANAACPTACAGVSCGEPGDGPQCDSGLTDDIPVLPSEEEQSGCTDRELEQTFFDDVYTWRGRCFPCHFDTQPDADKLAPRWISATGNCATGSAVTLKNVVSLGLLNTDDPDQSLLLLKPLDVPGGGVAHGGGDKFSKLDPAYASFQQFAQLYAGCQTKK